MRKNSRTLVALLGLFLPVACLAAGMQAEPFITLRGLPGYTEFQIQTYNSCFFAKCAPDNTPSSNPGGFPAVLSCSQTCMMSVQGLTGSVPAPSNQAAPAPTPKKTEPKTAPAPAPAKPACAEGMQKLSDGTCVAVCPASEHKTRKSPTECGCEPLYKMSSEKECLWSVENGFTFDGGSRDAFQEKVEKLGPNEGTFVEGKLANGKSFKVGVLRLPDGSYVYTNDGIHFFTDLKKAVNAGLFTKIGEGMDNIWSGLNRLVGIGKYAGKDTANDPEAQRNGQFILEASNQTQKNLEAAIGDPAKQVEVGKGLAKQWGEQFKTAAGGDTDQTLKDLADHAGVDPATLQKALTGDAKGVGDDVMAKIEDGISKNVGVDAATVKKALSGDTSGLSDAALDKVSKAFKDKTGFDPDSIKKALRGDYSGLKGDAVDKFFAAIKDQSGVDVPFIKDALKGDFSSVTENLAEKLTTFPADSVVILAKELRSASFANAVRVYIAERESGTAATKLAANPTPELDYVTNIQGVSQQYVNAGLFAAYEEAYQRFLIRKAFGK